jgi:hypothetical protein
LTLWLQDRGGTFKVVIVVEIGGAIVSVRVALVKLRIVHIFIVVIVGYFLLVLKIPNIRVAAGQGRNVVWLDLVTHVEIVLGLVKIRWRLEM